MRRRPSSITLISSWASRDSAAHGRGLGNGPLRVRLVRTAAGTQTGVYPMVGKTGRHAILEQLLADGIRYLFGNPGTVGQGFPDALADHPGLQYILSLPASVALARDVLEALNTEEVVPTSFLVTRTAPEPEVVARAASLLRSAANPLVLVGDGIASSEAQSELVRVSEALGAAVWGVDSSELNMSTAHPLYPRQLRHMFGDHSRPITSRSHATRSGGSCWHHED